MICGKCVLLIAHKLSYIVCKSMLQTCIPSNFLDIFHISTQSKISFPSMILFGCCFQLVAHHVFAGDVDLTLVVVTNSAFKGDVRLNGLPLIDYDPYLEWVIPRPHGM